MSAMQQSIQAYLDSQKWNYQFDAENQRFLFKMSLKDVDGCNVYIILRDDTFFRVYATFPLRAPEDKLAVIAEFITRANYGLKLGNFEMDYSDGEIRYKTTAMFDETGLSQECIEHVVDLSFTMLNRYAKGFLGIIYGGATAEAMIKEIEG